MVDVTVDIAAGAEVREELLGWVGRIPQTGELDLRLTDTTVTARLGSPPQLATLAMAVATYLRTKPAAQRPVVTVTAANGESLELTTTPNPNTIRSTYIAMDKQPSTPAITGDVLEAEVIDDPPS